MNRPVKIGLVIAAALLGDVAIFGAFGSYLFGGRSYAFDDNDLPRHLTGRWDWSNRAHPCGDSAHVITFSPDRRTMTIAMPARPPRDTGWSATYDLLSLEPSRLRGVIRGEKRRTKDGKPVVWDLVMAGPNEYRWHRTDWPAYSFTSRIRRCGSDGAGDD
jgi:hypothetical protein